MAHSHFGSKLDATGPQPMIDPNELRRHRRALRILIVVLIPLAIWTVVGLVALWPGDISEHVNSDVAGYSIDGVTYPNARISTLAEISCDGLSGSTPGVNETKCANATVTLLEGDDKDKAVTVPLTSAVYSSGVKVGQTIKLVRVPALDGQPAQYQFSDFERRTPLIFFTVVFALVVIGVARWRGFASLIGLGFAGFILVKFMFPALVAGTNPLLVGLIGSSAIMFVVLYAAHGFSARTTTALVGTLFGLILIATLGYAATRWAHLTGVSSEEDFVLSAVAPDMKLTSVVMCGIIVAGLGVLNDVTITQASAVWELAEDEGPGRRQHSQRHLFTRAMRIGRDHIASTVYTIAFATAGASLAVLLLIAVYDRPMLEVLQTEQFAGELIRTLVGSIGLVLAVPLTTAIGVAVVRASGVGRRRSSPTSGKPEPAKSGATTRSEGPATAVVGDADGGARNPSPRPTGPALPPVSDETSVLPATKWRDFAAPERDDPTSDRKKTPGRSPSSADGSSGGAPSRLPPGSTGAVPPAGKRRRRHQREDDEFGDFTYLRDAGDNDPGPTTGGGERTR